MTNTARLLGHLKWLRDNLRTTPRVEDAVYSAAIRLRAETTKDRTPDAILPKTVRRELRAKVDTLIDTSREASEVASGHLVTPHNYRNYLLLISKKIGTVTRLGARAKLFDGQAIEWREASQPMSLSELMAFVSSPHKDKEAPLIKSSAYQRKVLAAFKTILSASLLQAKARTEAERKLAAEALEVGAAMLSEASRGLNPTREVRKARKHDKALAAMFAKDQQRSGRPSK